MKKRLSFVSNSSSCSFFIWIKTDDDLKAINNIKKELIKKFNAMYFDIVDINDTCWKSHAKNISQTNIFKGDFIYVDAGEDNQGKWVADKLTDIYNFLISKYNFKFYADPDAHVTAGSKYIDEISNEIEQYEKEMKGDI